MVPSFHTRVSTAGSLEGVVVGIHAHLGLTSASMGQPVKKNAVHFSRLGCGSFSLPGCYMIDLIAASMRSYL